VQSPASQQGDAHPSTASSPNEQETQLYPLQLDVVKHLATLSVVRSVLACVFGQSHFIARAKSSHGADIDADHSFYDFALEQSERYPPLNRWIQLEANSQHLSDSTMLSPRKLNEDKESKEEERVSRKRSHPHEEDLDSQSENKEEDASSRLPSSMMTWNSQSPGLDKLEAVPTQPKAGKDPDLSSSYLLMFDWENETPYAEAVQRLTEEGKLVDALALADRWLQAGAPDSLLQLLIERGEETGSQSAGQWKANGGSHLYSSSWQYCIRLHNKTLAATLALKYLQRWELDAAIDVLTMCSCHLSSTNPLHLEVARKRQLLQQYGRILQADNQFTHWQEVESLCQSDPEGLALRLAGKGAVSAALDVAETFKLSSDLRRELQGRQLVKLLTTDPINGGGPAGGLRFLNSLLQPEDALPVAMAAMEQLPNLQSKQLLVHFFLKRRVGTLSEEEHARLDRLALGLRMLGALPLPWQQRCSALHEHPRLILETLLMGKQLRAASQLLQAFPSLREDDLVTIYAAKALSSSNAPYERRTPVTSTASVKPVGRSVPPVRSNFSTGLTSLPKRAFLWSPRDTGNKIISHDSSSRKRKSAGTLPPFQKATWEALAGLSEEPSAVPATVENYGRPSPTAMTEEWVLTGDLQKDDAVRSSHCYESAPNFVLFKVWTECKHPNIPWSSICSHFG
jgi:zinc finger FYVE domain-containing protein 26